MKYEVILFDADNTLWDYNKSEEYSLEKALRSFNVEYQKNSHLSSYREINKLIWDEFEKALITVEQLKIERFRKFFKQFELTIEPEVFSRIYLDCLAETAFLIDGADEILADFNQHYKLVLITNGLAKVQHSRLKRSLLKQYFQDIIISEEVGVAKPKVEIFEHTFERINHSDKKTALIVGDSLSSDIQGGFNFGIDTCWYNPTKKKNISNVKPTYEIHDLRELKEILV